MTILSQTSISLRQARRDDAADIAALGSRVFTVTFGHSVPPHELQAYLDENYSVGAIAKDLADLNKDTIVATTTTTTSSDGSPEGEGEGEGAIVGFAMLTRGSREPCVDDLEGKVELQRIYVHVDQHGKGVGKLLSTKVEDMARQQGFEHMWLGVWEENHKARKVYEKLGYRLVGDHDFVIGGVVQTDHIMVKTL